MEWSEDGSKGHGVLHPLQHPGLGGGGHDAVCADAKLASSSADVLCESDVHCLEHLDVRGQGSRVKG